MNMPPTLVMEEYIRENENRPLLGKDMLDLPEEIMEYILSFVPPYQDLKNCMLVCKNWCRLVKDVVRRRKVIFSKCIKHMDIVWSEHKHPPGPSIAARYTHSCCRHGDSMYVFGGCTASNTTFNDLWRFDLNTKRWIRPLAIGTYPPPKACATFVPYKDVLILFGGWTHPSPYPIYQTCRLFNHVHIYELLHNNWLEISMPGTSPPRMAGHSATVHGDCMVVFGGGLLSNGRFQNSSNDVWVMDLITNSWWKPETTEPKPDPRFGQTQIRIDDDHILIVGGCGGPNKVISDMWLLKLSTKDEPWRWTQVSSTNNEHAASHIWCHPACKVGDKVVFLDKCPQTKATPSYGVSRMIGLRIPQRVWIPPRVTEGQHCSRDVQAQDRTAALQILNDRTSSCKARLKPSDTGPTPSTSSACASKVARLSDSCDDKHLAANGACQRAENDEMITLDCEKCSNDSKNCRTTVTDHPQTSTSAVPGFSQTPPVARNTPMPSIRPNSMKNRQRQLEGFQRMEERIRNLLRPSHAAGNGQAASMGMTRNVVPVVRKPMYMYVLDISMVVSSGQAHWLPVQEQQVTNCPEETTFYSLICGRGELIMFGGIQKDHDTNCEIITGGRDVISNNVHILSGKFVL